MFETLLLTECRSKSRKARLWLLLGNLAQENLPFCVFFTVSMIWVRVKEEFLSMVKIFGNILRSLSKETYDLKPNNIRDVTQKSLRQAIGVVPQDSVLFNSSIGYNIGWVILCWPLCVAFNFR